MQHTCDRATNWINKKLECLDVLSKLCGVLLVFVCESTTCTLCTWSGSRQHNFRVKIKIVAEFKLLYKNHQTCEGNFKYYAMPFLLTSALQDIKNPNFYVTPWQKKFPVLHLHGFLSGMVWIYFESRDFVSNATSCGDRSETCQ